MAASKARVPRPPVAAGDEWAVQAAAVAARARLEVVAAAVPVVAAVAGNRRNWT